MVHHSDVIQSSRWLCCDGAWLCWNRWCFVLTPSYSVLSLLLSAMLIQLVWMRYWFEEEIKFMMDNSSSGSVLLDPDDSGILTFHLACCVDGGVSVI